MSEQVAVLSSEVDNETFLFLSFFYSLLLSYLTDDFSWLGVGNEGGYECRLLGTEMYFQAVLHFTHSFSMLSL